MMNKSDWYKNRILWRAGKLFLDSYLWSNFMNSNEIEANEIIESIKEYGYPLIIFWHNSDEWTAITDQFLVGRSAGIFSAIGLDDLIEISTENDGNLSPADLKKLAEYIKVGHGGIKYWTPSGNCHFSLINILNMFPIGVP